MHFSKNISQSVEFSERYSSRHDFYEGEDQKNILTLFG